MRGSQPGPDLAFELGVEPVVPLSKPRWCLRVDVPHRVDRVQVREVEHRHAHRARRRDRSSPQRTRGRPNPRSNRRPAILRGASPRPRPRCRGSGRCRRRAHLARESAMRRPALRRSILEFRGTPPGPPATARTPPWPSGDGPAFSVEATGGGRTRRLAGAAASRTVSRTAAGSVGSSSSATVADRSVDAAATSSRMRRARIRNARPASPAVRCRRLR